jgi:O-antigen/teichoic acid export membrane protein
MNIDNGKVMEPIKSLKNKIIKMGRHFLVYGVGSALQGFVTFLLLPILSDYYTLEDYGKYTLIVLVGTVLGLVFYFGAQSSITRFYYEQNNQNYKLKVVTNATLITLIGALICVTVGFLSASFVSKVLFNTTEYSNLIILSSIAASFTIINTYLVTYLRLVKKSFLFIFVNVLNLVVNFLVTLILLRVSFFEEVLIAPFAGQIMGILISVLFSVLPVMKMWNSNNIDLENIKMQFKFSFPIIMNGILFSFLEWSDRIVIEEKLSIADVGIYSFGYKIGTIITLLFVLPFGMIFSVLRMEYVKDRNSNSFFSTVTTYYTIIGMTIVIMLTVFAKSITLLASSSSDYVESFLIVPWILLGRLFLGYAGIFDFGIYYAKKTYHYLWIYTIALFLNIALNYLLVESFGYQFAAINKMFSYFVLIIILYITSEKYFHIPIERRLIKLSISFIIVMVIVQMINVYNYSIMYSLLAVSILGIFWVKKIVKTNEKIVLVNTINQLKRRYI